MVVLNTSVYVVYHYRVQELQEGLCWSSHLLVKRQRNSPETLQKRFNVSVSGIGPVAIEKFHSRV